MNTFRRAVRRGRIFILCLLCVEMFYLMDGRNFVHAYQEYEAKEERLEEISDRLGIPVDELRPERLSALDRLNKLLGDTPEDPVKVAGRERLLKVLQQHAEQVANNPYLPEMEAVEQAQRLPRVEGHLQSFLQLTQPRAGKRLSEGSQNAMMRNLHHGLWDRLELPDLPDGVPSSVQARQDALQADLDSLRQSVRPVVASTQIDPSKGEKMLGTLPQKVEQLRLTTPVDVQRPQRAPRFVDRPLPNRRVEDKARQLDKAEAPPAQAKPVPAPMPDIAKAGQLAKSIDPALAAQANDLGHSPAQILRFVREEVHFDPKWGATKSPLGTLEARRGTSWDQAWLLQQLLQAGGVDARLEWGEVEITTEQLQNLTGLDDPWRAGDLLTTAGNPVVLITAGSQVVAARMQHAWVRAYIDYVPNRGVTPGPGDSWVVMDPSLVDTTWSDGLRVHENVPFSLASYLQSGTELSPRRAYEDALWSYIRANDIQCTTLEQLKASASVQPESVPFVPGTLKADLIRLDGQAASMPDSHQTRLAVTVRTAQGQTLATFDSPWPALYGQRFEIAWPGATADDQATLDAYGDIFQTPPYLVDLAPELRLDGQPLLRGDAVGAARDIEVEMTLTPVHGVPSTSLFQLAAGERAVVALDLDHVPQQHIDRHRAVLAAAETAGDTATQEAATLALLGSQYLHNLGRDLADLGGWKRQRVVQLGTLGMTLQTGRVGTSVNGAPLSFEKDSLVVDIATMPLGLFPVDSDREYEVASLELLGSQSSFLEGALFDEVLADEGISAVAFLTRAVREGQNLLRLDATNAAAVLDTLDLGDGVEASIQAGIAQGKIAWVPESQLTVNQWRGSGYILEDPSTGAAGYLASGGYGAGAATGKELDRLKGLLGSEPWLGEIFGGIFGWLFDVLGVSADDGPTTIVSDPINLSNGNMIQRTTDLQVAARGLPIEWSRTYNSQSDRVGWFGLGWTFTYGETLEPQTDGSVLYLEEDGTEHVFESDGNGGWISPAGKHLSLTREGSDYRMRTKQGYQLLFDSAGRLQALEDRDSNTITLTYGAEGDLQQVVDAAGRVALSITSVNGRITAIEDLLGRTVTYGYAGDNLTSITDVAGETWHLEYDSQQNLVALVDPLGHANSFAYDGLDRCVLHVDPLGARESFSYTRQGERATMTDARGYTSYWEMDERGRTTLQADPLGNATRVAWNATNNRTSIENPRGGMTTKTWDSQGNMLTMTDPLGNTTSYDYEPEFSQPTRRADALGHEIQMIYDPSGRLVEQRQAVGDETIATSFAYDSAGRLISQTDGEGATSTFRYADDPQLDHGMFVGQTDALGFETTYFTDPAGRLQTITDPQGNVTQVEVDARSNPTLVTDWRGTTMTLTYDSLGRPLTLQDPSGVRTLEHDAKGQVVANVSPLGNRIESVFDAAGNVVADIDARGNTTTIAYDPLGRRSAVIDPAGGIWTFGFCNELGQSTAGCSGRSCGGNNAATFCDLTNPLGQTVKQEVDPLGRVVQVTDPLGNSMSTQYDPLGRQTSMTDALGFSTQYNYDAKGRLVAVTEADGAETQYAYDFLDRLIQRTDGEGRIWNQEYDDLGRVIAKQDPLGHRTTFVYDSLGNLSNKTDANGTTLTFRYLNQLLQSVEDATGQPLHSFGYDAQNRRQTAVNDEVSLEYAYDAQNRPARVINHTLGETLEYTYDANGNRKTMVGPKGIVEYEYDTRNFLVEIRDPATGTYRFDYDVLGRRTLLAYPNGVETSYVYDDAGRLVSLITRGENDEILDGYHYAYDARNNQVGMTNLRQTTEDTYAYDARSRLVRWERGEDQFEAYSYDHAGNRLRLEDPVGVVAYTYDASDRLLTESRTWAAGGTQQTSYGWDANGNQISKSVDGIVSNYSWDPLNRLVGLDTPETALSFGYDPSGVRTRRSDATGDQRFLHDYFAQGGYEQVIGVVEEGSLETYFTQGSQVDEVLATNHQTEGSSYYLMDRLGSVTAIVDSDSSQNFQYSSFGQFAGNATGQGDFRFSGRPLEAGIGDFRARFYDASTGRFLSRDPFQGTLQQPQSQNNYAYVNNSPQNYRDPSGMIAAQAARVAAGAVFLYIGMRGLHGILSHFTPEFRAISKKRQALDPGTSKPGLADYFDFYRSIFSIVGAGLAVLLLVLVYMSLGARFLKGQVRLPTDGGFLEVFKGSFEAMSILPFSGQSSFRLVAYLAVCGASFSGFGLSSETPGWVAFADFAVFCVAMGALVD